MIRAGLIGLGNMGKGMGKNIVRSPVVEGLYVSEISDANVSAFLTESANNKHKVHNCTNKLSQMTDNCSIIGLSLPSEQATIQVLFGNDGIVSHSKRRPNNKEQMIVFDHGTFSRDFILDNHKRAKEAGIMYIDAPVSGGPGGADAGTLTIMAGGDKATISRCEPLWKLYSKNIFHFGDVGTGMAAKLINQALVGVHAQAACEVLFLAEEMGINNTETLREMLGTAWGQSKILDLTMMDYIKGQKEGWQSLDNSAAPLRNLYKDFKCVLQNQTKQDKFPLIESTSSFIADACDEKKRGLQNSAFVALIKRLR
jgi:3-hydroxyisobutyrate dehydrogenase